MTLTRLESRKAKVRGHGFRADRGAPRGDASEKMQAVTHAKVSFSVGGPVDVFDDRLFLVSRTNMSTVGLPRATQPSLVEVGLGHDAHCPHRLPAELCHPPRRFDPWRPEPCGTFRPRVVFHFGRTGTRRASCPLRLSIYWFCLLSQRQLRS